MPENKQITCIKVGVITYIKCSTVKTVSDLVMQNF